MKPFRTHISIKDDAWLINGKPTYEGHYHLGNKVEGLLFLSRTIVGIFDDENKFTRELWKYPDTGVWDPMRNTRELVEYLPVYKSYGLNTITIGLQGGSPLAYRAPRDKVMKNLEDRGVTASEEEVYEGTVDYRVQPWHNSAFGPDGSLKPEFMERLTMVIEKADELGMVVIVQLFYFGQDERLKDEKAIKTAVTNACKWVLEKSYTNVLIDITEECNSPGYEHEILLPHRVHELIEIAKKVNHNGRRLLVGTGYASRAPDDNVVAVSDMIMFSGNGLDPEGIVECVERTREQPSYKPMPILYTEDDHYEFEKPVNNFTAALSAYAGWGYFDNSGETTPDTHANPEVGNYKDGYQNIPVNWGISSIRKKAFFNLLRKVTGT